MGIHRCALLFNCTKNLKDFKPIINSKLNAIGKLYRLNIDYFLIIEGEESEIETFVKNMEGNLSVDSIQITSWHPIEHRLLCQWSFQDLHEMHYKISCFPTLFQPFVYQYSTIAYSDVMYNRIQGLALGQPQ